MKTKIFAILLLSAFGLIYGQKGNIKGKIIDHKTKQPLIGANVMITGTDLGAATNEKGIYLINDVPENVYKLKINYLGYNSHIEPDIRVIRDKTFFVKEIELIEAPVLSDEVTVTSGYFHDPKDMPVSNYTFTKEEIVRAPGAAGDIFRALETLPGVTSSGGEFSAFSVRGGAPKDNIILVDNIPFSNISHFLEASGNEEVQGGRFSIFTTGLIEKANFQGGGFSSKYGGKKASFLDLSIKEGNKESFSINGSYDLFGWEVNYDGPSYILDNTSIRFSGRSQDFKTILEMMDQIGEGHPVMSDYILKITSELNAENKISLLGIYSTETSKRTVDHLYKAEDLNERSLRNETEDKSLIGLNWRWLSSKNSFLNTSVYYSLVDQNQAEGKAYPDPVNGVVPTKEEVFVRNPIGIYDSKETQYGIKTDFTYNVNKSYTINTGLNIQQIKKDARAQMFGKDTLYYFQSNEIEADGNKYLIINPDEINNTFKKDRTEISAYAEATFQPLSNLHLNAGFRYEYDNIIKDHNVSPRFSGSYLLGALTSINFAAGIYYQLPEMLLLSSHTSNVNVKNEKAYHYILGITRYLSEDLKFTAEGYYKKLEDLIVRPNSNNGLAVNTGKGYSYGLDLSLMKRFVNNMYGQVNYSYGVCKVKDNNNESYYDFSFNQPHIFNLLVGYQFNDNWSVTAKWKYASGRPKDSYIIHENVLDNQNKLRYSQEITHRNNLRLADFHTLNIRVDYRKQFSKFFAITAYLDILNAYDNANEVYEEFIPVTGKISAEGMGLLPTLGFKIEI